MMLIAVSLLLLSFGGTLPTKAATHYVYPGGSIQAKINAASSGDTVFVYSGTYYENVFIDKTIKLVGEHKSTTIIDGRGTGTAVLIYDASNLQISGFTFQNSSGSLLQGLLIWDASNNNIFDNIFQNNFIGLNIKSDCTGNSIHHNSFINNSYHAINNCSQSPNQWDDSVKGNYWDDYSGSGPYTVSIPYGCQDRYPLQTPPGSNSLPTTPFNPTPPNGATSININQVLYWNGGDPDGDMVTYDIYFGTSSQPPLAYSGHTNTSYNPGVLQYTTKYYWRIISRDSRGASATGPVWSFTTARPNDPPNVPMNPAPASQSTAVPLDSDLSWTGGDPDPGDIVTYDVYFDTVNPPTKKVSSKQSGTMYDPGTMNYTTTYYWKIVAWDSLGLTTVGPVWVFTTKANSPPHTPGNPNPSNHLPSVDIDAVLSWTGGDPDPEDLVTYDVYFGTSTNPPKVSSNQSGVSYDPILMTYGTQYYWKIRSWDTHGIFSTGPLWDFTTGAVPNDPPFVPSNPAPAHQSTAVPRNATLSWTGGDPNPDDTVTYDIYLGSSTDPLLIQYNHGGTNFAPPTMDSNTTYYWKIVSKDSHGRTTSGPLWQFTTVYVNNPPHTPSNPTPSNGSTSNDTDQNLYWSGGDPDEDMVTYDIYFGTSSQPPLAYSGHTSTSYNPGVLQYTTRYYWKIVAWDDQGDSATSPLWSFSIEGQPPGGGGSGSGGGGGPMLPPNLPPTADASASDTTGFVNTPVTFDGSNSHDEDGEITNHTWEFGDGHNGNGVVTTHTYQNAGVFMVTLTVTDDNDVSDTDTIKIIISKPSSPPTIPQIDGQGTGTQHSRYNFTFVSTDPDGDTIKYYCAWGDGTTDESDFLPSGTAYHQTHQWISAGVFKITVYARDKNYTASATAEQVILIDAIYCGALGYLVDEDSDGVYDFFVSNQTGIKTVTEKQADGFYLINSEGGNDWEYQYHPQTDTLTPCSSASSDGILIHNAVWYAILLGAVLIILLLVLRYRARKKKNQETRDDVPDEQVQDTENDRNQGRKDNENHEDTPPQ